MQEQQPSFGCMSSVVPITSYCAPLQRLLDEHPGLREQMQELIKRSTNIRQSTAVSEEQVRELIALEHKFKAELDAHSEREEGGLFPILGRHIGTEFGPIAVMEYEHSEAKLHLSLFEERTKALENGLEPALIKHVTDPLLKACHILLDHFLKEENVLFPMAEMRLSDEEKAELHEIVTR